jgi:hypothetical protein
MIKQTKKKHTLAQDAALLETIVDASSTMDLHRSNMMRLQVQVLLKECHLHLKSRKWASDAHEYLQRVTKCVERVNQEMIFEREQGSSIAIKDRADKVVHIDASSINDAGSPLLHLEPLGCAKRQFAWTRKSGNAQQLPTFSFMITLPTQLFLPKDYLHYRYFDVSYLEDSADMQSGDDRTCLTVYCA